MSDSLTSSQINNSAQHSDRSLIPHKRIRVEKVQEQYPRGWHLLWTMLGLCLGVFCVALDNTIIATAIPRITDEFHDLQDVGWYGSAYLLTCCAFQLTFGKLYASFSIKLVYMSALFIFELGSLICGVAKSSVTLIVGRAIAGLGSAGVFSGAMVIVAHSAPIHKRPVLQSSVGAVFGIASVAGPLLGGVFTDKATWRWCFWMNLPIGFATATILALVLNIPRHSHGKTTFMGYFRKFDPVGTILFVPSIVCLLLALQWGGTSYAWDSNRIVGLFMAFVILLTGFIATQFYLGEQATVPPRIISQRTMAFVSFFAFCLGGAFYMLIYLLPIWFQAIHGFSAVHSGIVTIPLILSNAVAVLLAGGSIMHFGPYMPWVYVCVVLTCVGSGLIYSLSSTASSGMYIGYQIIYGFGTGCAFQVPQIAAQVVFASSSPKDIPIAIALSIFFQFFGSAILVSVGNNVVNTILVQKLQDIKIPNFDALKVVYMGATQLRSYVPEQYLTVALDAYGAALKRAFLIAVIMSCLGLLGALGMEWRSVHHPKPSSADTEKEGGSEIRAHKTSSAS